MGLGGAVVFTLLFAAGGALPLFTIAWIGNRLTQSIGWAGLVKVCSKWFNYTAYGTIVGILSVSFLVGDAAARASMRALIRRGYDWRALFVLAAGIAGCMLLANALFLRESASDAGHDEPTVNPTNVFNGEAAAATRRFTSIVRSLLSSRAFVLVCLVSLGSDETRRSTRRRDHR